MKKIMLTIVACMLVYNTIYAQETTNALCITSNNKLLNADIYILLPDKLDGQLLSGQFCRIAGNLEKAAMSYEDMNEFVNHEGKKLIKYFGDAYMLLKEDKKFVLAEIIRNEDDSFEPMKIYSIDKTILSIPSFIDIIIPRKQK